MIALPWEEKQGNQCHGNVADTNMKHTIRHSSRAYTGIPTLLLAVMMSTPLIHAAEPPRLGDVSERFRQSEFASNPDLVTVRAEGLKLFATPFNHADGFGDGPVNPNDTTSFGGRPSLGNNGTFLRINGLDGQSCVECHAQVSSRTVPPTFGVGGFGGINDVPIFQPKVIDVSDASELGFAFLDGRLIVPPHLFGSGGVQQVGHEMTEDLARIRTSALAQPGEVFELESKGVHFGTLVADAEGNLDFSDVEGVDDDLIIKPFGRKGEFATVRDFDMGAMQFHFGMQPVEVVGEDVDDDGDGVVNEVFVGEMAALEVFITTMDRPVQETMTIEAISGLSLFSSLGCSSCHMPVMETRDSELNYRHGDEPAHYSVELTGSPMDFQSNLQSGVSVPLFSDLKRHDMGDALAESFQGGTDEQNREFITAKLWGVSDSAPYLHDGRALTITEAIGWHGGEAQFANDNFQSLSEEGKSALLAYLATLRLPQTPNQDVLDQNR